MEETVRGICSLITVPDFVCVDIARLIRLSDSNVCDPNTFSPHQHPQQFSAPLASTTLPTRFSWQLTIPGDSCSFEVDEAESSVKLVVGRFLNESTDCRKFLYSDPSQMKKLLLVPVEFNWKSFHLCLWKGKLAARMNEV